MILVGIITTTFICTLLMMYFFYKDNVGQK